MISNNEKINPFPDRGTIVRNAENFIGRKNELKKIRRRLIESDNHTNLAIIAEKGIGASSLAYKAFRVDAQKEHILVIWLDLSTFSSVQLLFCQIAKEIVKMVESSNIYRQVEHLKFNEDMFWGELFDSIKELLKILICNKLKLICVIDEFDKSEKLFHKNISYFQALREIAYHPDYRMSLVVISRREVSQIEIQSGTTSTLDGIFEDRIYLKPYDRDEMDEFYSQFTKNSINLKQEHKVEIFNLCGGWPYLLNVLCYEVFESYLIEKKINIKEAFNNVKNVFYHHYDGLVNKLGKESQLQPYMQILWTPQKTKYGHVRAFLNSGLIREQDGQYNAFSRNFESYLKQFADFHSEKFLKGVDKVELKLSELTSLLGYTIPLGNLSQYDGEILKKISFFLNIKLCDLENDLKEVRSIREQYRENPELLDSDQLYQASNLIENLIDRIDQLSTKILIKETTFGRKETTFDRKEIIQLPIAIKQFSVRDYHELKKADIEIPDCASWVFFTGENGFGKTLLLQALVIALNGGAQVHWGGGQLATENFNAALELIEHNSSKLYPFRGMPGIEPIDCFAAYGPSRLNIIQYSLNENDASFKSDKTYGIFNPDGILLNIERRLLDAHKLSNEIGSSQEREKIKLEQLKNVLKILLEPYIEEIYTDGKVVRYLEKNSLGAKTFEQLASGLKSMIAMAGDIIIRLADANNYINPNLLQGIVIIDEFDLHLHPKWQKALPGLFSKAFPLVQFVVSTHSAIPLLGAPENSAVFKVIRDTEGDILVEPLEIVDIENLQPNLLLSSPIFDMEDIFHINKKDIAEVRVEDTWDEFRRNQKISEDFKKLK